jgi:S-adenosylmethionine decarboxylase
MDYRVRGFTRDVNGRKIYMDHDITSIQDYVSDETLKRYIAYDINIVSDNMFHTKMILKKFDLDNYLFGHDSEKNLASATKARIRRLLKREMQEIFECRNLYEEE